MKKDKRPKCKCGKPLYVFNGVVKNKLCPSCRNAKKIEKLEKHKKTKAYDEKNFKTLHRKCWKLMSFIVRKSAADEYGMVSCYTCPKRDHYKKMDAGHYWHDSLDFDRRNLKPQCDPCNRKKSGNLSKYSVRLIKENGLDWFMQLERDAAKSIYKTQDLINLLPLLQEEAKKYE